MSTTASKKRKYFDRGGGGGGHKRKWGLLTRPRRGNPGVLLTCETGREQKCKREGLEILNHYHRSASPGAGGSGSAGEGESENNNDDDNDDDRDQPLSLEEELSLLKSKKGSPDASSAFGEYETNCRGTVFVLCTLPKCSLIPAIQTEYMRSKQKQNKGSGSNSGNNDDDDNSNSNKNSNGPEVPESNRAEKKAETKSGDGADHPEPAASPEASEAADAGGGPPGRPPSDPPPWDPIAAVRAIMSDIDAGDSNKAAPSSRFVTRMIPIQATCFASPEELGLTCEEVLKKYVSPKRTKTFAIRFKRRNCSGLDRKGSIQIVGDLMQKLFPDCRVDLGKPDATIVVEVCGTLCGVSVVENFGSCRNFNLLGAAVPLA
ncbi:unnamed protein product [Pseudo-nitzschia multistriata]|uniref:THUMP domain-containing protein n=1 Tax=Pseudo-nitzschia multistriata TaxID=183589 RepID=A0A448YVS7_9STRA|nr:unnamed protein product [Pseudo-nitzschia multistriata]